MSDKRSVLKVLDGDVREKRNAINEKYRVRIDQAEKRAEREGNRIIRDVRRMLDKVLLSMHAKADHESLRISIGGGWGDIKIDGSKYTGFRDTSARVEVLTKQKEVELDNLNERASAIRRRITLCGVDEEVLKLLESL